jgi:hypothetical protein
MTKDEPSSVPKGAVPIGFPFAPESLLILMLYVDVHNTYEGEKGCGAPE